MRINHSCESLKKNSLTNLSQEEKEVKNDSIPKPLVVQVPLVHAGTSGSGSQQVAQPQALSSQGMVPVLSSTQNTVTVQVPQQGNSESQGQQQVVILMPQQLNQTQVQSTGQAQQPIVIVMPQTGGAQVAQPIVVPFPQMSNN